MSFVTKKIQRKKEKHRQPDRQDAAATWSSLFSPPPPPPQPPQYYARKKARGLLKRLKKRPWKKGGKKLPEGPRRVTTTSPFSEDVAYLRDSFVDLFTQPVCRPVGSVDDSFTTLNTTADDDDDDTRKPSGGYHVGQCWPSSGMAPPLPTMTLLGTRSVRRPTDTTSYTCGLWPSWPEPPPLTTNLTNTSHSPVRKRTHSASDLSLALSMLGGEVESVDSVSDLALALSMLGGEVESVALSDQSHVTVDGIPVAIADMNRLFDQQARRRMCSGMMLADNGQLLHTSLLDKEEEEAEVEEDKEDEEEKETWNQQHDPMMAGGCSVISGLSMDTVLKEQEPVVKKLSPRRIGRKTCKQWTTLAIGGKKNKNHPNNGMPAHTDDNGKPVGEHMSVDKQIEKRTNWLRRKPALPPSKTSINCDKKDPAYPADPVVSSRSLISNISAIKNNIVSTSSTSSPSILVSHGSITPSVNSSKPKAGIAATGSNSALFDSVLPPLPPQQVSCDTICDSNTVMRCRNNNTTVSVTLVKKLDTSSGQKLLGNSGLIEKPMLWYEDNADHISIVLPKEDPLFNPL